jgi:hypothetical protein
MAAIYDKALKRKDLSGIANRDKQEQVATRPEDSQSTFPSDFYSYCIHNLVDKAKAQIKEEKAKAAKAVDPKVGADVGKIVNLMAGDANRVWNILFVFRVCFLLIPRCTRSQTQQF